MRPSAGQRRERGLEDGVREQPGTLSCCGSERASRLSELYGGKLDSTVGKFRNKC